MKLRFSVAVVAVTVPLAGMLVSGCGSDSSSTPPTPTTATLTVSMTNSTQQPMYLVCTTLESWSADKQAASGGTRQLTTTLTAPLPRQVIVTVAAGTTSTLNITGNHTINAVAGGSYRVYATLTDQGLNLTEIL
jgi:hypothetical protein